LSVIDTAQFKLPTLSPTLEHVLLDKLLESLFERCCCSISSIVENFKIAYEDQKHTVLKIRVGLPVRTSQFTCCVVLLTQCSFVWVTHQICGLYLSLAYGVFGSCELKEQVKVTLNLAISTLDGYLFDHFSA
jgi:hypothetical protein